MNLLIKMNYIITITIIIIIIIFIIIIIKESAKMGDIGNFWMFFLLSSWKSIAYSSWLSFVSWTFYLET